MKKYKLNVAFGDYPVGHVFKTDKEGTLQFAKFYSIPIEIALMLHTGFLEEVVEKEWPQDGDEFFFINSCGDILSGKYWQNDRNDQDRKSIGNCKRTHEAAEAALARVKKALRG